MELSETPPTNEGLSTFTCFSRLPLEIREMIWEGLISVQRYLRIESRWAKQAKIGSFSIPEGLYLSRVCSESRKVIFRIIAYQTAQNGDGASIDRHFDTVLLTTLDAPSLEILSSVTTDIDSIAIPLLQVGQVEKLHLALKKRVAAGRRQIKVIHTGRRFYYPEQRRPPGNYLVTPPVDFKITVGLETESRSLKYMFWTYPTELLSTWARLTSKDEIPAPVMKRSITWIHVGIER